MSIPRKEIDAMPRAHHALLFMASESVIPFLQTALDLEFTSKAHSDISYRAHDSFGIDEARALKLAASIKPIEKDSRTFVLSVSDITREAQNALLKLFEDPPETARFILIVPNESIIIPTLRSRLFKVEMGERVEMKVTKPLSAIKEALEMIAKAHKDEDTTKREAILVSYEHEAVKSIGSLAVFGKDAMLARRYFSAKGASTKMLLEHVALSYAENSSKK